MVALLYGKLTRFLQEVDPIHGDLNELSDSALVKAAQADDRQALNSLLSRHYDRVYAICRRLAGNEADGQDATQEALIAIVRGLPRFTGRSKFTTWAYRVSTNAALDELRRRSRRPVVGLPEEWQPQQFVGTASHPADPADAVAERMRLSKALAELPEVFRVAVVLRDVLGLSYEEIGEVLEIPPGTVRSRIARGRSRLAGILRSPS